MKIPAFLDSIRGRLILLIGVLLVGVIFGFGFSGFQLYRSNQLAQIDVQLASRVSYLAAALRRPPDGEPRPPGAAGRPRQRPPDFYDFGTDSQRGPPRGRGPGGDWFDDRDPPGQRKINLPGEALRLFDESDTNSYYYAVWSRSGRIIKQSTNSPTDLAMPTDLRSDSKTHYQNRGKFREAYYFSGRGDTVLSGISLEPFRNDINGFALKLILTGSSVLLFGFVSAWWLATSAVRPVRQINATANRIASGSLSERITATGPSEIRQLAGVLNDTFARLESAFEQQRQFTADASHEIRTPLAVIISEAQTVLNRQRSTEEYREALGVCLESAQQMRRLADSLMALARFDIDQHATSRNLLDLSVIAERSAVLVQGLAREKGISLELQLASATVRGDQGQMSQVLLNLLQNAIFYNRSGGSVKLFTGCEETNSVLKVADTGIGIGADDLPRIFDRFYRADKARSRQEGRTGLGLAITKAIIEAHGGSIRVESSIGKGSVFTVCLPRAD